VAPGRRRALLTLCRYGAVCRLRDYYREILRETEEFGELLGSDTSALETSARAEAAALAEVLPYDTPEDLYLVTSGPILTEVQRKLIDRFGHTPAEAASKRFALASIAVRLVPDFDALGVGRYTRDRSDDMIVHTALEGGADFIVTTDLDLLEDGEGTQYSDEAGFTVAYSLEGFAQRLETSKFSLGEVPEVFSLRVGDRKPIPHEDPPD
jgi:predicted nucleic acid-binding protein